MRTKTTDRSTLIGILAYDLKVADDKDNGEVSITQNPGTRCWRFYDDLNRLARNAWERDLRHISLLGIILYMETLELDELFKAKFTESDAFPRVLPSCPREILIMVRYETLG